MNDNILKTLEFDIIRQRLASLSRTAAARKKALSAVPSSDERVVRQLLDETDCALQSSETAGRAPVAELPENEDDIPTTEKLHKGIMLGTKELLSIASLLESADELLEYEKKTNPTAERTALSPYYEGVFAIPALAREIRRCIIAPDEIADDASPELHACRMKIRSLKNKVKDSLQKMLSSYAPLLSDALITTRDDRFVLPVKAENKSRVPGIVHGASATGQTLYIEPLSVVEANNAIREEEENELEEIRKILSSLSASAAASVTEIESNEQSITALDHIFARAALAGEMHAVRAASSKGMISAEGARHPLLDPEKVVPVDIVIAPDGSLSTTPVQDGTSEYANATVDDEEKHYSILIITGPNTGGKTVSLKTLGILAVMNQCGLFVPAKTASLPVFREVFADIGDPQSIEESLSTFSGHMKNITSILKNAQKNDLVLFDELCAGTDPAEGAALAGAIIEYMRGRGINAMISTHYAELKSYALTTDGVQNASMEFNEETLSPTFRLHIGLPGKSNAFAISKRLGLPGGIIADAKKRMGSEAMSLEDLLGNLERERRRAQSEADRERKTNEVLSRRLEKLEARELKLDKQKDDILKKANEKAANILKDAKDQYDAAIRELNRVEKTGNADMSELEKKRRNLSERTKGRKEKAADRLAETSGKTKALKPEEAVPGLPVLVLSMGGVKGSILSEPDRKGNVDVRMGIITSKVNIKDLAKDNEDGGVTFEGGSVPGTKKKGTRKSTYDYSGTDKDFDGSFSKTLSVSPEIMLIGMNTGDAMAELDKYLDDAYLSSLGSVRIVHGKGSGILRKAVQDFLKKDPRVKSFREGEFGEGDSGVTIAVFQGGGE